MLKQWTITLTNLDSQEQWVGFLENTAENDSLTVPLEQLALKEYSKQNEINLQIINETLMLDYTYGDNRHLKMAVPPTGNLSLNLSTYGLRDIPVKIQYEINN